jgi:hypothetical protein
MNLVSDQIRCFRHPNPELRTSFNDVTITLCPPRCMVKSNSGKVLPIAHHLIDHEGGMFKTACIPGHRREKALSMNEHCATKLQRD